MEPEEKPDLEQAGSDDDVLEWAQLGERLAALAPDRFRRILLHLREVVAAQESISQYEWARLLRIAPRKRTLA